MNEQALMVFAKAPEPGRVKTRLGWSGELAARLHSAFVLDVLDRHAHADHTLTLWTAGDANHPFWQRCPSIPIDAQVGDQLGERMENAFRKTLNDHQRVVIIGTDSPTLPSAYVRDAFNALKTHSVVIGPAEDGGYVLLGMADNVYPIFPEDMPWGQSTVFERTTQCLEALDVDYATLPPWYDVDHPQDVSRLYQELAGPDVQERVQPSRTFQVLRDVFALANPS